MLYIYRAFLSGSKISPLSKELTSFMRLYSLYKRQTISMSVAPFYNAIRSLAGGKRTYIRKNSQDSLSEDDDEILAKSLEIKELNVAETVVVCKLMTSFIFRDLDKAEKVAREYLDFFEHHTGVVAQFVHIYRYFYGGLIVSC